MTTLTSIPITAIWLGLVVLCFLCSSVAWTALRKENKPKVTEIGKGAKIVQRIEVKAFVTKVVSAETSWTDAGKKLPSMQIPPLRLESIAPVEIESGSDPSVRYSIDIAHLTCTCPDFTKRRSSMSPASVGRLCKHLARRILQQVPVDADNDMIRTVLSEWHLKLDYRLAQLGAGGIIAIGLDNDREWCDVIARRRRPGDRDGRYTGPFRYYKFNLFWQRWAGGDPDGRREIRQILAKVIRLKADYQSNEI